MKIALIGSAPSSVHKAPYGDPSWTIWGCSPGAYGPCKRSDAWFEMHRWEPQIPGEMGTGQPWFSPEYCEFLIRHPGTVWMIDPLPPEVPNAKLYPLAEMTDKYGPFFWTSSLAFMFALALEQPGIEEIGLWGVDMSATEEYGFQRLGCQYFVWECFKRGIRVTIPPESDLLQPTTWYGVLENSPLMIKFKVRQAELQARLNDASRRLEQARDEINFLRGALDDVSYVMTTWVTWQDQMEPSLGKTGNEGRKVRWQGEDKLTKDLSPYVPPSSGTAAVVPEELKPKIVSDNIKGTG